MTTRPTMKRIALLIPLTAALLANPAAAEETLHCSLYEEVSNTQHLRRLSLDLRLQIPSYDEYLELGDAAVDAAIVDDFIASAEFADAKHE